MITRNLGKNYTLLILYLANLKIDILKSKVPFAGKALLILLCNYKNMKEKVSKWREICSDWKNKTLAKNPQKLEVLRVSFEQRNRETPVNF